MIECWRGNAAVPVRRARAVARAVLVGLLLGATACVTNPVTGRPEFSLMSPEREAQVGRQEAAKVAQQIGLVADPALVAYVEQIGARVARHSVRQDVTYRFFVADMPEPNAFALPGGYIYVSRGLLAIMNSEAELAGVIGHEIGHVAARHSAQRETRAMSVGLLTALGAIAGTVLGGADVGQAVGQLGQVAGAGFIASYSRDQERQADELGQNMSAAAGYDPRGITDFLRTLERETQLRLGRSRMPTFLDSHPVTTERVRSTSDRAQELAPAPGSPPMLPTRDAFVARMQGLLVGPDPAQGVFEENLFLHPVLDLAVAFPPGWKTFNEPTVVAAQRPDQAGVLVLEREGPPGDPAVAAEAFLRKLDVPLRNAGRVNVSGMAGFRAAADAQSRQGPTRVEWVWIAHPRGVFRMTALASPEGFERFGGEFSSAIRSFHVLTPGERARIQERRLMVVPARGGETLAALCARAGSVWSVEEVAVANGLLPADRLEGGFPVKIAVERPYAG